MERRKSSLDAHMKKGRDMSKQWFNKEIEARRKQVESGLRVDQDVLIRHVIDTLPGTTKLSATISDYWLRWDKATGAKRRKDKKTKSVFSGSRPSVATKHKIMNWAYEWVQRVGADAMINEVRGVRNLVSIQVKSEIGQKFPFMCFGSQVMGGVKEIVPETFRQRMIDAPTKVSIRDLTMEEALRRTWLDIEARNRWFIRWDTTQNSLLSALRNAVNDEEQRLLVVRSAIDNVGLAQVHGRKRVRKSKPVI